MNQEVLDQLRGAKTDDLVVEVEGHSVSFSNLGKVFWPATEDSPALTKRDYAIYLTQVAPYLVPHTTDRPLTLLRYPNGIHGQKFYQKHIEHKFPYVKPIMLWSEQYKLDHEYICINNLPTLLWLCQMADLELHTWMSRVDPEPDAAQLSTTFTGSEEQLESSVLNFPDYLILDLDPYIYSGEEKKGDEPELNLQAFRKCCEVALCLKEVLDQLKIKSFLKTTGKTGLHIYIPILRHFDFDRVRSIANVLGRALVQQHPNDVTMEWAVKDRTGKIFYDHNMNGRGKTLASIYSPRVAPGAPVSIPVRWEEVESIYPADYKMLTVPDYLAGKGDLWADILDHKNDLAALMKIEPKASPRRNKKA
jgi:bifunctional non-homologous end joining protein LigD